VRVGGDRSIYRKKKVVSYRVPVVIATRRTHMQLRGYIEKIDLGADPETGLPNILVESAAEYHALPREDKKRAWCLVKVATELLHLGPVAVYEQAAEGKVISQVVKKNPSDRKGLTIIKIEPALTDHKQARNKDKERVLRRLKRVLRSTWWFNDQSETLLLFIVSSELECVEAEEFGTPDEKKGAFTKRYQTYTWLVDIALQMIKDQETKEGKHEGNK
jgi:hypothetical protein